MTLGDIATVCALCSSLLVPTGIGIKYYADHEYVTANKFNQSLQWQVEDEMAEIQARINNGTASDQDLRRMAVLKERKRNLAE